MKQKACDLCQKTIELRERERELIFIFEHDDLFRHKFIMATLPHLSRRNVSCAARVKLKKSFIFNKLSCEECRISKVVIQPIEYSQLS